jgi:hypothetical protein
VWRQLKKKEDPVSVLREAAHRIREVADDDGATLTRERINRAVGDVVAPAKRGRSREPAILSRNKGGGFDLKVRNPSRAWQNTKLTVDVLETVLDPVAEALGAAGATAWTGERRLQALDVCLPLMEAVLRPREGAARPTREQRRQLIDLLLPLLREEVADQRKEAGGREARDRGTGRNGSQHEQTLQVDP